MIDYGYTGGSLLAILVAVAVDLWVLRTRLLRTRLFWATYAIVVFFQLIVNGVLTGLGIVQYDPRVMLGIRLAYAPIEDLGFGFGLVTLTLVLWAWLETRRGPGGAAAATGATTTEAAPSKGNTTEPMTHQGQDRRT
ncbi:lycopene cyclase domain-containing protein [Nakamurella sp. UYEF19]|uniref:lycopene cyclase domain-containing protein n=1 Tax=Nakamurella sp. UYEF19 TaxID=1756392 RepID=UPI0033936592